MSQEWLLWVVGQIVVAAAIWGGIRSDIKSLHSKIAGVEKMADKAHERIDDLYGMGDTGAHRSRR